MKSKLTNLVRCTVLLCGLSLFFNPSAMRAADSGLVDRTKTAATDAKEAVKEAGRSVADKAGEMWKRIDEEALKNRKRDEIVAWIIMGALVGGMSGLFTALGTSAV